MAAETLLAGHHPQPGTAQTYFRNCQSIHCPGAHRAMNFRFQSFQYRRHGVFSFLHHFCSPTLYDLAAGTVEPALLAVGPPAIFILTASWSNLASIPADWTLQVLEKFQNLVLLFRPLFSIANIPNHPAGRFEKRKESQHCSPSGANTQAVCSFFCVA